MVFILQFYFGQLFSPGPVPGVHAHPAMAINLEQLPGLGLDNRHTGAEPGHGHLVQTTLESYR